MVKRLYDATIFVQSLDSIDRDKYLIATYYIEDSPGSEFIDHFAQLQRLVLEGSTGSWARVDEETEEVRETLAGRLVGYYEIPAEAGTKKAVIQIAYPTAAWDRNPNIPMMLLGPMGNCFIFSKAFRVLDVAFPPTISKFFSGPKFGVPGVRDYLGVHDRPLVLHIIKPKMGMTPEQTAEQCYKTALGGVDLIKDDEMAGDIFNCTFEARMEAVIKALEKAERETGKKVIYLTSVTDSMEHLKERARWAARNGGRGLLFTYSGGLAALDALASDPEVNIPILLHVSHMLGLLPSVSFTALAKLGRVAGADIMLAPSYWSSYQVASLEECLRTVYGMQQYLPGIKPTFPMPGGGLHPGLVPLVVQEYGIDIILGAGGGLLGHPQGYTAGAQAMRQAVDAVMEDIPLEDYAKSHPALQAALETWGTFKRPKTPWGYASPEFRPNLLRR